MQVRLSRTARISFGIAAAVAWFGIGLSLVLTIFRVYPAWQTDPAIIGSTDATVFDRLVDFSSYFTNWSNILAAVVMTGLALGRFRDTPRNRVLRADSLLMMSVTGILYAYLLAADAQLTGLEHVTNFTNHTFTPISTAALWFVFGPRGWMKWWTPLAALIVPMVWLGYTVVRAVAFGVYPYPFFNAAEYGWGAVLTTAGTIIVFGAVLGYFFWAADLVLNRFRRSVKVVETELA